MSRRRPPKARIRRKKKGKDPMDDLLDIDIKGMTMTGHLDLSGMSDVEKLIRKYTNGD